MNFYARIKREYFRSVTDRYKTRLLHIFIQIHTRAANVETLSPSSPTRNNMAHRNSGGFFFVYIYISCEQWTTLRWCRALCIWGNKYLIKLKGAPR